MIKLDGKAKGIFYLLLSAFFFTGLSIFARLAGDLPAMQKSFFRNLIALGVSGYMLAKEKVRLRVERRNIAPLFGRAVFGTIGMYCNFYAIDHMLLADATIFSKLVPFFAILFSYCILKERIKRYQIVCLIIAFAGCALIVRPGFQNASLLPYLVGLAASVSVGLAYPCMRLVGRRGVKKQVIVFYFSAVSTVITIPYMLLQYHPMTMAQLGWLLLAGASATCGQFAVTTAYTYASAADISVYDFSQVFFSMALGYLIFGQMPDAVSLIGYAVIFFATVRMFLIQRREMRGAVE